MRKITSILMLFLVCIGLNAQVYPISFDVNASKANRYVESVKLISPQFGEQTIDVSSTKSKVYNDYTSQTFTVAAGEEVTPVIGYTESWMHGYVYVDLDNNNAFDIVDAESDELVSFTYYEGKDSKGATKGDNCNANNPPAFTAPTTPGTYYIRFKVDWNNIEPAGSTVSNNLIVNNRGSVIDVKMVVQEAALVKVGTFYTLECYSGSAHSTSRFIFDDGSVITGQSATGSNFTFEEAGDGGYYIKSAVSNKYISHSAEKGIHTTADKITSWKFNAPAHTPGAVTLTIGDDKYLNNNGSDCTDGSTTNLKANYHSGGPGAGNACSLWKMEEVEVFVPAVANGVYEIQNFDTGASCSRGYLVNSTAYPGQIKLAESQYPGLSSTQYAFASRTESGVNSYWYVYNSSKENTYIFSLADGQFMNDKGGDAVVLSATPYPVKIVESGSYLKIQSTDRESYVTAAVGWGQSAINVRWNNEYNDGGHPYTFNTASVAVNEELVNAAIAAIEEFENPTPDPIITFDNSKAYLLHNPNGHGYLMYAPAKSEDNVWVSGEEGKSHANFEVQAVDKNSANFYWQIITHNEKTYLYNVGAQKFVTTGGPCKLVGTPTSINMTALADPNAYAFNTGTGDYGFMCASEHQGHYVSAPVQYWSSDDAGAKWVVEENETLVDFDNTTALVMIQNYEGALTAEGILASYDGVGYPVDSERELLATAAANSKADCKSTTNLTALAAAAASYKSTSNVKMPEDGKAYTFKNVQKDGTTFYFACDATTGVYMSENEADACTFVCKVVGDKYVFVNNNGQYLAVKGSSAGTNGNKGFTEAYDQTEGKFFNDFTITKLTPSNVATGGNTDAIAVTDELLFGYVGLATQRTDRNELIYFVIKNDKGFDQANAPFCRHNLTSMVKITEVEYPNKPVVNGTDDVDGVAAISTFCAPFATVAPNNVEVYIAASDESHYIKLQKVEGAVPANTGVVLVSTDDDQVGEAVTMVPATTETLADVTGNLLRGDAAKGDYAVDAAVNAYVLGAVDGVAGFYPLSASDRTIKQGKAYLKLDAVLSAVKLYFGGDEATGIETVVKENANAPIFDLSGRRVVNVAKGGIYIQNGKKFIVK